MATFAIVPPGRLVQQSRSLDPPPHDSRRVAHLPMRNEIRLQDLFRNNAVELIGEKGTMVMPAGRNRGGSTDMGNLSHLIPAIHPYTGGANRPGHSKSYVITDYETAVIDPAKIMAMVAIGLLPTGPGRLKRLRPSPPFRRTTCPAVTDPESTTHDSHRVV